MVKTRWVLAAFLCVSLVLTLVFLQWHFDFIPSVKAGSDTWQVASNIDDVGVYEGGTAHPPWDYFGTLYSNTTGRVGVAYITGEFYGVGLRFTSINIPQGADVTSAYLKVKCKESDIKGNEQALKSKFWGEDSDDAAPFSDVTNYNGRSRTSNTTTWDFSSNWTIGSWHTSPDLESIIQEIIDRPEWQSGNTIVVFWEDAQSYHMENNYISFHMYESDPTSAATFEISWSAATPTIGEFQAPTTCYANKYFFLNCSVQDADGKATIVNATVGINDTVILKYDNASDTFSEHQDTNGYCSLDAENSVRTEVNSTSFKLSWKVKFHWNYTEGSIFVLATNTVVFDSSGANGTGTQTSLFTFEDDLVVHTDTAVDDDRVDPSDTVTFTGTLYYEGTSTVPEDVTGITAYVELNGVEKGNDTDCTAGSFSVAFSAESSVDSYSYNIYAVTDQNTVTNQTISVIIDKAKITSGGISSSYLHVGEDTTVYYVLQYEYDLANITDGSVTLNGSDMTYVAARYRWEINITESTGGDVAYQIDAVAGNTYGITALNDVAGPQDCTFYVNVNFKTVDYDGNTLASVTVSICNGSGIISGEGGPSSSGGMAVVGGYWFSEVVSSGGWANYTGITNSSIQVYASWYGLIVNSTFTLSTTTDRTIDLSCLCYPFVPVDVRYHVASDATISTVTWSVLTHILAVEFSSLENTYSLIVTGSKPTYLLNLIYDLDVDYTSYLDVAHYSNAIVYISYANWASTYIQSSDQHMTSANFVGTKLTMTFTGTGTGQVEVYCGSRGNPAETGGFTTTSYAGMTLTGYYAFASDKTVWLQWSTSSSGGPGGPGDTATPLLITLEASLTDTAFLGKTVNGLLTISWTGATSINVWSITLGGVYQDWIVRIEGLPLTLDKSLDSVEGTGEVPFTLTVPSGASLGKHHIPLSMLFGLATGGTKTMGISLSVDVGSYRPAPVPNMMVYIFLAVICLIVVGGVFTKTARKRRK